MKQHIRRAWSEDPINGFYVIVQLKCGRRERHLIEVSLSLSFYKWVETLDKNQQSPPHTKQNQITFYFQFI